MQALATCPCGAEVEFVEQAGDLPFRVQCKRKGCLVSIEATHEDFVLALWNVRSDQLTEGGFEIVEYDKPPAKQKTAPAVWSWKTDPRTLALVRALHELEVGGPAGITVWGVTGMRERARKALMDSGMFSERALARHLRESGVTLQATRTDD